MGVNQTLGLISVFAHCTPILLVLSCGFSSESLLFSKITFFSHTTKLSLHGQMLRLRK